MKKNEKALGLLVAVYLFLTIPGLPLIQPELPKIAPLSQREKGK